MLPLPPLLPLPLAIWVAALARPLLLWVDALPKPAQQGSTVYTGCFSPCLVTAHPSTALQRQQRTVEDVLPMRTPADIEKWQR